MKKRVIVIKIGGSGIGGIVDGQEVLKNFDLILLKIEDYISKGYEIVLIFSAFKNHTAFLKILATRIKKERIAYNLSKGETSSNELLAEMLEFEGYTTRLFNLAHDIYDSYHSRLHPIILKENIMGSEVVNVDIKGVSDAINLKEIPIIPGFIGRSISGEWGTLELDGSDITAALISAKMKEENYDVTLTYIKDSILMTDNPKTNPSAKVILRATYVQALKIQAISGNFLHRESLLLAQANNIPITIATLDDEQTSLIAE